MPDLKKVIDDLKDISKYFFEVYRHENEKEESALALDRSYIIDDAIELLKEQETMPSYNDAVDTIKCQSKVLGLACETLAGYESEEPCNTLFYIKEQRQKCDERCCNDKTPDEWCWRRYCALMATEDSPSPEQMRDTPWKEMP